nr:secretin and TonB N-terminal domain-containing protein [Rickettsiella endosymbiont of Dermanyssus gallinae]
MVDDKVQGNLSLHLNDIPWEQALDIILKAKDLVKYPIKNSWVITPQSEILQRDKEKLKINIERQALSPMLGKLIQIRYSKATILADLLKDKTNNILSSMGSVNVDKRGNSLWVKDSQVSRYAPEEFRPWCPRNSFA